MGDAVNINAEWKRIERTSKKTGKITQGNYRVDLRVDDLIVDTDARDINREFSGRIAELIKAQVKGISRSVSPSTLKRRQQSALATNKGDYYTRRYAGGQIGEKTPNSAEGSPGRYFNDSGRFVDGLVLTTRVSSTGQSTVTLNAPANRLNPDNKRGWNGSLMDFQQMLLVLQEEVPLLAGKTDAKTSQEINEAMSEVTRKLIANSEARHRELVAKRNAMIARLAISLAKGLL